VPRGGGIFGAAGGKVVVGFGDDWVDGICGETLRWFEAGGDAPTGLASEDDGANEDVDGRPAAGFSFSVSRR
jgi:hypothetical protein